MIALGIRAPDVVCASSARSIGRLFALTVVGLLVVGCISQRPLQEPEARLHIQKSEKYAKSADGGSELVNQAKDEVADLSKHAIVVMRGELLAPKSFEYKAINIYYTTQSAENAYNGRTLTGDSGWDTAKVIEYSSEANSFYAVAVEPGTYRYVWNALGNPAWVVSRFSPTRQIEFTVEAGEAVYVGDLQVVLRKPLVFNGSNIVPSFVDYKFKVDQDQEAASRFYNALPIAEKPPLEARIMTNNPVAQIERYGNPKCDGLWYIAYSSRGFCK